MKELKRAHVLLSLHQLVLQSLDSWKETMSDEHNAEIGAAKAFAVRERNRDQLKKILMKLLGRGRDTDSDHSAVQSSGLYDCD